MIDLPIGTKEFARIVGTNHAEVSRAVTEGLIPAIRRGDGRGPGNTALSKELAEKIAAAAQCGVPWRIAAKIVARITLRPDGVFISAEAGT